MLRRRRRSPREDKHAPASPHAAPRSRRRARPDTPVPPQLRLPAGGISEAPTRVRKEPRRREDVVLVTGFDPFGGEAMNPSWEVCGGLPPIIAGRRVERCRVPCQFRRVIEVVAAAIERHGADIVICLGQAGGRTHLSVERVAINVDDARIDDNAGAKPIDQPIAADGPAAYFSTLPIKAMTRAMREAGVPAEVSNSAGTYVCNHLMYGVLHFLAGSGNRARAGFIHLPYAHEQALDQPGRASLSLQAMVKGIEAAIVAAVTHAHDISAAEGRLD